VGSNLLALVWRDKIQFVLPERLRQRANGPEKDPL
jgi:hypothetical protein